MVLQSFSLYITLVYRKRTIFLQWSAIAKAIRFISCYCILRECKLTLYDEPEKYVTVLSKGD